MPAVADNLPLRCVLWHPPGVQVPGDLLTSLSRRIGYIAVCTDPYAALAELCANERDRLRSVRAPEPPPPPPTPTTPTTPPARPGTVLLLVHPTQLPDLAEVLTEVRLFAPQAVCWKYDAGANPRLAAVVDSDVTAWMARGASAAAGVEQSHSTARTATTSEQRTLSSISSPFAPAPPPRRAPTSSPVTHQPAAQAPKTADSPPLRLSTDDSPPTPARPSAPEVVVRPQPRPIQHRAAPTLTLRGEMPPGNPPDATGAPPLRPRPMLTPEEMRMLLGDDPTDPAPGRPSNGHHPVPPQPPSTPGPDRAGDRR